MAKKAIRYILIPDIFDCERQEPVLDGHADPLGLPGGILEERVGHVYGDNGLTHNFNLSLMISCAQGSGEVMELIVAGLDETANPFKHLWGRYIIGMKPETHCIKGLVTKVAAPVTPWMKDGRYTLRDDLDLFYLCGVGRESRKDPNDPMSRRHTNVHLAVSPRKGSVASVGSVYGAVFTIKDAEAIAIKQLPDGFGGLPTEHYRCKNFQFAYQIFDVSEEDCHTPGLVVTKRRQI